MAKTAEELAAAAGGPRRCLAMHRHNLAEGNSTNPASMDSTNTNAMSASDSDPRSASAPANETSMARLRRKVTIGKTPKPAAAKIVSTPT